VLAVSVLGLGGSGAGYLNAAFGAGGVLGILATIALVGRARLVPPLVLGVAAWSGAFALLGARPSTWSAFFLLGVAGVGRTVLDVAGRSLLQRLAPPDLLARLFGALEGIAMAGLAAGSLLAPLLVHLVGARTAVACAGAILPLVVVLSFRRLYAVDAAATAPVVEIALLRSLPLFAPLGGPTLESLARSLELRLMPAGADVVVAGESGAHYYAVADGELTVSVGGVLRRGDGFGEIALLKDVPRTATVTASTDVRLYALEKDDFLTAVTGHAAARAAADRLVQERLRAGAAAGTLPS
jgi:Cyclic nucleotide-binding domain